MAGISIRTTDSQEFSLEQADLNGFRSRLKGQVLLPGDAAYDEHRTIWNAMIDRKPAMIARCIGVADVIECVRFAAERNLLLSIKGGGHNIAGLAVSDGAFLIDMSLMRGVWVNQADHTAVAQAGCLLGDVDRETQIHGLAAILGFVSNTGIAGLTLGGGFGYLTRRFGWTSDNVLSMEMVTGEGKVVQASQNKNDDLFWGLCGGGGNFGVVTKFEYKLYPLGPEVIAGGVAWPAEAAEEVLEMYRGLVLNAPVELSVVAVLRIAPPAPWLPKEIHGKPIVALFVCDSGPIEEAEKRVAPLKSFKSPIGDILQRRPYVSQQNLLDATQPKGRRYYWKSEYLAGVEPGLLSKMIEHSKRFTSPHSAILLFPIQGALNKFSDNHSAAGNRDASIVLNITGAWENAADDAKNVEWAREAWKDLRQYSTGGTYINFLTEEEGDERIQAAYRNNLQQLTEIKTKWDPKNMFRMNKNIRPA